MRVAKRSKNLVSLKSNHKQEWSHCLWKGKEILYINEERKKKCWLTLLFGQFWGDYS